MSNREIVSFRLDGERHFAPVRMRVDAGGNIGEVYLLGDDYGPVPTRDCSVADKAQLKAHRELRSLPEDEREARKAQALSLLEDARDLGWKADALQDEADILRCQARRLDPGAEL